MRHEGVLGNWRVKPEPRPSSFKKARHLLRTTFSIIGHLIIAAVGLVARIIGMTIERVIISLLMTIMVICGILSSLFHG